MAIHNSCRLSVFLIAIHGTALYKMNQRRPYRTLAERLADEDHAERSWSIHDEQEIRATFFVLIQHLVLFLLSLKTSPLSTRLPLGVEITVATISLGVVIAHQVILAVAIFKERREKQEFVKEHPEMKEELLGKGKGDHICGSIFKTCVDLLKAAFALDLCCASSHANQPKSGQPKSRGCCAAVCGGGCRASDDDKPKSRGGTSLSPYVPTTGSGVPSAAKAKEASPRAPVRVAAKSIRRGNSIRRTDTGRRVERGEFDAFVALAKAGLGVVKHGRTGGGKARQIKLSDDARTISWSGRHKTTIRASDAGRAIAGPRRRAVSRARRHAGRRDNRGAPGAWHEGPATVRQGRGREPPLFADCRRADGRPAGEERGRARRAGRRLPRAHLAARLGSSCEGNGGAPLILLHLLLLYKLVHLYELVLVLVRTSLYELVRTTTYCTVLCV